MRLGMERGYVETKESEGKGEEVENILKGEEI